MDERYDAAAVEAKWQRLWQERRTNIADLHDAKRPYYTLMMFHYPSAEGLHVGHAFAFPGVDNGKVRGRIAIPRHLGEESIIAAALADSSVRPNVEGRTIRKQIVVPGRLVSFVV